jgi:hypothetical protein
MILDKHSDLLVFPTTVSRRILRDLLTTAVEGGINHWAGVGVTIRDGDWNYLSVEWYEQGDPENRGFVTPEDLLRGLERLSKKPFPSALQHMADALSENGDAGTADVVFQMTVLGELMYG